MGGMNIANVMNAGASSSKTESDRPTAAIREEDEYRRFREKRKMSKKKIKGFFGESVKVDVSCAAIDKKGLSAMLQSNVPLCYFLFSLLEDLNAENLFFYLEVEQFEEHDFQTVKAMRHSALELYNAFIKAGADFELNLEARIRDAILPRIEAGDQGCFSEARDHVVHLLEPCFSNFTLGPLYQRMLDGIGENTTMYTKEQRHKAIQLIVDHLDKGPASTMVAEDKAQRKRALLLREMIHSFVRTRLHSDFKDEERKRLEAEQLAQKKTFKAKKPSADNLAYAT